MYIVIVPAGLAQLPGLLVAMALGSWVIISFHLLQGLPGLNLFSYFCLLTLDQVIILFLSVTEYISPGYLVFHCRWVPRVISTSQLCYEAERHTIPRRGVLVCAYSVSKLHTYLVL
jgi:hypothetical protein